MSHPPALVPSLPLNPKRCVLLLRSLTRSRSLRPGTQLHALLLSSGLLLPPSVDRPPPPSPLLLLSKFAAFYSLCGRLPYARSLFDRIPHRSPFLWNTLIRGHVQCGLHVDALRAFSRMASSGCRPDNFTFPFAIKACGELSSPELLARIHAMAVASGFGSDEYVQNSLMAAYMDCGERGAAATVFDRMSARSVVSWNTMIAGCCHNSCPDQALMLFDQMMDAGLDMDEATVVAVLPACAILKDLLRGRLVHELVGEKGLGAHVPVRNALVDMYAKCGSLEEARRVFDDGLCDKDIIAWTAMIGGYTLHGHEIEALVLARQMQLTGITPNSVTMAALLASCAALRSIKLCNCVHGLCIKLLLKTDIVVETALIDMYAKCNRMDLSSRVFSEGSRRTATWNAIISGFSRNGGAVDGIKYFKLMLGEEVKPDLVTISSVLPAYADSADLQLADNIHSYLIITGFMENLEVTTGLVDAYTKAGNLVVAWELFHILTVKDFISWSTIISGFAMHGHAKTAIWLFNKMVESGVAPSEVTFTSLLYACSHAGLVKEGLNLFNRMIDVHHLKPIAEHYSCVIDLLGRAGRLQEAYNLIRGMSFEPDHTTWGALLGACVIHENVELGELAAKHLFELQPDNSGNYVLLGNIYAAAGRWVDVESVRSMMMERGLKKNSGCSLIETTNANTFGFISSEAI